jgi:DNA-binding MarR family transcriptional regulator
LPERAARATGSADDLDLTPAEQSFGYLLRHTSRMAQRLLQDKIESHGITLGQNFILRELWEDDGLTMRELATRLRILDPTVATTVDSLEARGLVVRERSEEDRRRVHARLTEKGKALRTTLLRYAAEVNRTALEGIPAEDVAHVKATLLKVKQNLAGSRFADE